MAVQLMDVCIIATPMLRQLLLGMLQIGNVNAQMKTSTHTMDMLPTCYLECPLMHI
jgi:hypothetical protein